MGRDSETVQHLTYGPVRLRYCFDNFKSQPFNRLMLKIRRRRSKELARIFETAENLTLADFNRDIWAYESGALWNGEQVKLDALMREHAADDAYLKDLEEALDRNEVELHGNYTWGSHTAIYGVQLAGGDEAKQSNMRTALRTLSEGHLTPLEKAQAILDIKGFGPNISTGLVMMLHPTDFAIYNQQVDPALRKLGLPTTPLAVFQQSAQALREIVGAEDYLELDWFLYNINQGEVDIDGAQPPPGTANTRYWKIAPGEKAHLWNRCRRDEYIAIGWPVLGDVRHITRAEFQERAEETLGERQDYTMEGMEQLWRFAREMKSGDRVLANRGFSQALGFGVVIGDCEYVEGVHYRHRWPVLWYDTEPRAIQQKGWVRTLIEMKGPEFEALTRAAVSDPADYWKLAPYADCWDWNKSLIDGVAMLGYDALGDVGELHPNEFSRRKAELLAGPNNFRGSDLDAVWNFATMRRGFKVLAVDRESGRVLGNGEVTGEYTYDQSAPHFRHRVPVTWEVPAGHPRDPSRRFQTMEEISVDAWRKLIVDSRSPKPTMKNYPLNQILYGPPGTGKTYNTIERAVEIIQSVKPETHEIAKERFDALRREERIDFVTFHQSYSYEDFVEGIRPVMGADGDETGVPRYRCHDGIFKKIATRALAACLRQKSPAKPTFSQLYQSLLRRIENEPDRKYPGLSSPEQWQLSVTSQGNISGNNLLGHAQPYLCGRDNLERVWRQLGDAEKINSVQAQSVIVTGAHTNLIASVFNVLKQMEPQVTPEPEARSASALPELDEATSQVQDYLARGDESDFELRPEPEWPRCVLVIDEINRGNISKILGELITLIEPDKRLGQDNSLPVELPYSGQTFVVPSNLYLLGTMNTADKSLALLDVALRRRFKFYEFPPNFSDKVCPALTTDMRRVLETLNLRITLRKDRDHRIGHAFFVKVGDQLGFNEVFRNEIIPLLQEYFYNDWDGLRFVLGEAGSGRFVRALESAPSPGARNRWQWSFDAGLEIDCLQSLLLNYAAFATTAGQLPLENEVDPVVPAEEG